MKIESKATYTCMRTLSESVIKCFMFVPRYDLHRSTEESTLERLRPGLAKLNSLLVQSYVNNLSKVNLQDFQRYVSRFKLFVDNLVEKTRQAFRDAVDVTGIETDIIAAPYRLVGNWIHNYMTVGHVSITRTGTKRMPCTAFSDTRLFPENVRVNPNGEEFDSNLMSDVCYQFVFRMTSEDRKSWYKLYHDDEDASKLTSQLLTEFVQLLNEGLDKGYILWESAAPSALYAIHEAEATDSIISAMISHPIYGGVEDAFTHSF